MNHWVYVLIVVASSLLFYWWGYACGFKRGVELVKEMTNQVMNSCWSVAHELKGKI